MRGFLFLFFPPWLADLCFRKRFLSFEAFYCCWLKHRNLSLTHEHRLHVHLQMDWVHLAFCLYLPYDSFLHHWFPSAAFDTTFQRSSLSACWAEQ